MPKYKVTIDMPKYETVVEAETENEAQNKVEEEYYHYLHDNDLNMIEMVEVS